MVTASFSEALVKQPEVAARRLARYRARLDELDAGAIPRVNERPEEIRQHAARLVQAFRDTERCELCGRRLEDPESKKRRIGPECLRKQTATVVDGEESF